MYAIVENGGKQYRVEQGVKLTVDRLVGDEGALIDFGKVLMIGGEQMIIGAPVVDGASVSAKILAHGRDKKKVIFRYKNKNRYRVKKGHRQPVTQVQIETISAGGVSLAK